MKRISSVTFALVTLLLANLCHADSFGSGANSFDIAFVNIGNPGNPPDANPNPAGAVPYSYRIGKFEISEQMVNSANALGSLGITQDSRGPDFPATSVTWYEAAKFVNWLNTSTGHTSAYKFNAGGAFQLWLLSDPGYNAANLYRNKQAKYSLPSINEWHKAAYYDPTAGVYYNYPTGSDSVPDGIDFVGDPIFDAVFNDGGANPGPNDITNVGLVSKAGTFGQGGNVREWEESAFDRINDNPVEQRRAPGGSWGGAVALMDASNTLVGIDPAFEGNFIGIRVVSVIPEPSTGTLLALAIYCLLGKKNLKRGS